MPQHSVQGCALESTAPTDTPCPPSSPPCCATHTHKPKANKRSSKGNSPLVENKCRQVARGISHTLFTHICMLITRIRHCLRQWHTGKSASQSHSQFCRCSTHWLCLMWTHHCICEHREEQLNNTKQLQLFQQQAFCRKPGNQKNLLNNCYNSALADISESFSILLCSPDHGLQQLSANCSLKDW